MTLYRFYKLEKRCMISEHDVTELFQISLRYNKPCPRTLFYYFGII